MNIKKKQDLINCCFNHLYFLPPKDIENAVVLISLDDGQRTVYQKLTGQKIAQKMLEYPVFNKLDNKTTLIYSSRSFLRPYEKNQFVTINYIMKMVKTIKFVFVFSQNQTFLPFPVMKEVMVNSMALFQKNNGELINKLKMSCALMIYDSNMDKKDLIVRIKSKSGFFQKNFIQNQQTLKVMANIIQTDNILICRISVEDVSNLKAKFINFVDGLSYCPVNQVRNSNIQLALRSQYMNFEDCKIPTIWNELFKTLLQSIIVLAMTKQQYEMQVNVQMNRLTFQQKKQKFGQINLKNKIDSYSKKISSTLRFQIKKQNVNNRAKTYLKFIIQLSKLILDASVFKQLSIEIGKNTMTKLLTVLYQCQYLTFPQIGQFFMSYFDIVQFLYNSGTQKNIMDLNQADFTHNFNENGAELLKTFIIITHKMLQIQLSEEYNHKYPFYQIQNMLNQLIDNLQKIKNQTQRIATDRNVNKFVKIRAEFMLKKAKNQNKKHNYKKANRSWINFVKYAIKSSLINDQHLNDAILYLGEVLTQIKEYYLALELYAMGTEYLMQDKIIRIYQKHLGLIPITMKYMQFDEWKNKCIYFIPFCQYLLKTGFNQKVRQLCYQGIVISRGDEELTQKIQSQLVNARSDNCRNLHNKLLEKCIDKDIKIVLDQFTLANIEQTLKKHQIIDL